MGTEKIHIERVERVERVDIVRTDDVGHGPGPAPEAVTRPVPIGSGGPTAASLTRRIARALKLAGSVSPVPKGIGRRRP